MLIRMSNGEFLGELIFYGVLTYIIYWILKKLTGAKTRKQKTVIATISIAVMLALILLSATGK